MNLERYVNNLSMVALTCGIKAVRLTDSSDQCQPHSNLASLWFTGFDRYKKHIDINENTFFIIN